MDYKLLGRTGVKVSPLCLGCMNFGWGATEAASIKIIHRALDAGINFVDTADVYGKGASETIVGKALKSKRDKVFLASKGHGKMGEGPNDNGNSRLHIMAACEASLKRLKVDHIDLYQIHRPQSDMALDETLRALDDLVRQGKVRYIGTSTFAAWQLVESLWQSESLRLRAAAISYSGSPRGTRAVPIRQNTRLWRHSLEPAGGWFVDWQVSERQKSAQRLTL